MIRPTLPLVSRIGYSPDSRWTSPSPPTSRPSPRRCALSPRASAGELSPSTAWTRATARARTRAPSCARSAPRAGSACAGRRRSAARSARCSSSSSCWRSWRWPARRSGRSPAAGRRPTRSSSYGSERLRREVLPAIARGEATFWQGYSEPGAGSDLLALKTEARRDGDDYVIRGHKIWSSHAGIATLRARVRAHQPRGAPQPRLQHVRGAQRHAGHGHPSDPEPHRRGLSLRGLPRRRARAGRPACSGREGEGFHGAAQRPRLRPVLGPLLQGAGARARAAPARRVRQHDARAAARRWRAIPACAAGSPADRGRDRGARALLFYRAALPACATARPSPTRPRWPR